MEDRRLEAFRVPKAAPLIPRPSYPEAPTARAAADFLQQTHIEVALADESLQQIPVTLAAIRSNPSPAKRKLLFSLPLLPPQQVNCFVATQVRRNNLPFLRLLTGLKLVEESEPRSQTVDKTFSNLLNSIHHPFAGARCSASGGLADSIFAK
ncbi:hypothetical protein TgHK011_005559 [Trichoderma gracile]|nr:hypothetical protein TgHK011_005559 [Trichoderma gracile]